MSYINVHPGYYQMLQPDSVYHPGAEGWSKAPVPGWGENPALVGPPRLAVNGLHGVRAVSGLGQAETSEATKLAGVAVLGVLGFGALWLLFAPIREDTRYLERRRARSRARRGSR